MVQNAKLMRCGNCGLGTMMVYKTDKEELIIECIGCQSTTKVVVSNPQLLLLWGENSKGILAIF